ncbi:MAG: acetylornithine deacetylase [Alphaproteobacteria bacterium]|nr:acetylornithine deacetylase [Alphaproteobacteria bacterium]
MSITEAVTPAPIPPDSISRDRADHLGPQIEWLERFVAFDTTSSKSNLDLIDCAEAYLTAHGATCRRVQNDDGTKANLYAIIGPKVEGGVVLSGHTDVVPVAGQDWRTDPFRLTEGEGKLYGRGTCDMKAFSAIALSLVPKMAAADLKRPIIFALSYDEEIGCLGAPRMIEEIAKSMPRPSAVIVGEPTMMKVVDGHKGIAAFRTTVTGHTTHSSQTDRGVSAVEAAAKLIAKVAAMREARAAAADPDCPFQPPHSTMTVNVVNGGTQLNIMAAECVFDWDCRVIPGETSRDVLEEFEDHARGVQSEMRTKAAGCRVATEQLTDVPALAPEADNPAADLAKAITGHNATEVVSYAAEAGQFQQAGFATVICGPGSIDQAHQANEFIDVDQIAQGRQFIEKLIDRLSA